MKGIWFLGIFGCPLGVCMSMGGKSNMKIGVKNTIQGEQILEIDELKNKKLKIDELNGLELSQESLGGVKPKIKISVFCMDGDLIGAPADWWKETESTMGGKEFWETLEKTLKGYMNLIFGCRLQDAINKAPNMKWLTGTSNSSSEQDAAGISIAIRKKLGKMDPKLGFEKLFEGNLSRNYRKKFTSEKASIEVYLYDRNEFKSTHEESIKKQFRKSIASALIDLIISSEWCAKKDSSNTSCLEWNNYKNKENWKKEIKDEENWLIGQEKLDGTIGIMWNPRNEWNGTPKWKWDKIKNWENLDNNWWKNVKEILNDIKRSSWFNKNTEKVAELIGAHFLGRFLNGDLKIKNFLEQKVELCKIASNGIICPRGGVIWKN
ncbi:hypothetical protein [Mycoplasma parvum]|nr:hypothetical protein [Mycoplasma parvum]